LRNPVTDAQRRYNRAHIQTRNVVERSIGILKRRFPCLSSTLAYQPEKVGKIMTVCAILHNIAIECQDQEEFLPDPNYVDDVFIDDNIAGLAARNVFIQTYFA
jgi:nuclease HARBI1